MELSQFLSQLRSVGTSPYAFAAYIAVVAAWVYTTVARHRLNKVAEVLKNLPPKDRLKLIEQEYKTSPRSGLSAEQWIRARRQTLLLVAFLSVLICATVVVIIAFVLSFSGANVDLAEMRESIKVLRADSQEIRAGLLALVKTVPNLQPKAFAEELHERVGISSPDVNAILTNTSLSREDKISLMIRETMNQLDAELAHQVNLVNSLPASRSIDDETMKLKRMIDSRSQVFAMFRKIIDKYNETEKGIIDSIGR
jgi:hypothetical protein